MPLNTKHEVGLIDTPNDPRFQDVYDCYLKVFTLPSEQESRENFEAILARNGNPELATSGACKEMWVYIKDPKTGKVMGATNFDVFAGSADPSVDGTLHGIYTFVAPEFRQLGVVKQLIEAREMAAKDFIALNHPHTSNPPVLVSFVEQNASLLMSPDQYIDDTKSSLDQNLRRTIYEGQDFRQLTMRYIQPPLDSEDPEICDYLDLCVKGVPGNALSTAVIREHLNRFFQLSFPEGTTLDHPMIKPMADSLNNRDMVELLPPGKYKHLSTEINAETLAGVPKIRGDFTSPIPWREGEHPDPGEPLRIAELFPHAADNFYGPRADHVNDVVPGISERRMLLEKLRAIPAETVAEAVLQGRIETPSKSAPAK